MKDKENEDIEKSRTPETEAGGRKRRENWKKRSKKKRWGPRGGERRLKGTKVEREMKLRSTGKKDERKRDWGERAEERRKDSEAGGCPNEWSNVI